MNSGVTKEGGYTRLEYCWFQGRGHLTIYKHMVKWPPFWTLLTKNRADGALVRLTKLVGPDEDFQNAEHRLSDFAQQVSGTLNQYVTGWQIIA